jgi:hypothetical protein
VYWSPQAEVLVSFKSLLSRGVLDEPEQGAGLPVQVLRQSVDETVHLEKKKEYLLYSTVRKQKKRHRKRKK